jgi:predicted neuraminidase
MQAHFLYNPPSTGCYCHAPTLVETARGELVAAWYAYAEQEHVSASLAVARRPAGASEWEPSRTVFGDRAYSAGNPVLFEEPGGTMWLLFVILKDRCYWDEAELRGMCSADGGRTWSAPAPLWPRRGLMVRHPPVRCADGSFLLPAYDETLRHSVLLARRSAETAWAEGYRFDTPGLIQPVLVRRPRGGELVLFFRPAGGPRRIWRSHSADGGASWSAPVRTPLRNPLSGIGAFALGDRLAVVYNDTAEQRRYPLSVAFSTDAGVTWGAPRPLDAIPYEISYPSFLVGRDGLVHGVYTYNRRMIKYVCCEPQELRGRVGDPHRRL